MAEVKVTALADVRPGDLFFTNIGGIVPGLFPVKAGQLMLGESARIGRRSFDHVGIVTEASETLPPGSAQNLRTREWHSGPLLPEAMEFGDEYQGYPTGVITAPKAVQAMPSGAEEIELREAKHWTDSVTFMRLPEDYPSQAEDAAAIARAMIGTPYSFLSYAALAAWKWGLSTPRLEKWIGRRREPRNLWEDGPKVGLPAEAICSVLVDQAWSLTGKKIFMDERPHQCVTPGQLAGRLLWMPGVEKFGKGIL